MHIKNEQPHRRYNNTNYVSHKCSLHGSAKTEHQKMYLNQEKGRVNKTATHYQCHKFRRVCMVMGVLVLIEESDNGGVSFQELMPKDYIQRSGNQEKSNLKQAAKKLRFSLNKKFNIATQIFAHDYQPSDNKGISDQGQFSDRN